MRKVWKRFAGMLLAFTMILSIVPMQAMAESSSDTATIIKYPAKDVQNGGVSMNKTLFVSLPKEFGNVTNLKSSNEKVVKVSKSTSNGYTNIYLTAKKKGTATVSYKYDSMTHKTKITVRNYKNPISSIKIGNTKIKGSKFSSSANYTLNYSKYKKKSLKVTVKMADGWELMGDNYFYFQKGWDIDNVAQRNGKKITVKGGKGFYIRVHAVNKKTGASEEVYVFFK